MGRTKADSSIKGVLQTADRKSKIENRISDVLILRFSALGDIAMTAPVVRAYAQAWPDITFTMAAAPLLAPLFSGIANLRFEAIDTNEYNGSSGPFRLFKRLRRLRPDMVLDLHQVLRTYAQDFLFSINGTPVYRVRKGRKEKRLLTGARNKHMQKLPSMIQRYESVFVKAGFPPLHVDQMPLILKNTHAQESEDPAFHRIGIAPFAKHETKAWPLDKMEALVEQLSLSEHYHVYLFGGGKKETAILMGWEQRYSHTECVAGTLDFEQELELLGNLELLVSMDSANMHFASYMGVPVLSIWGGTHPFAGFYGWRQDPGNAIQIDLECRPCSVFGGKPCRRGDLYCLQSISMEEVKQRIDHFFAS